MMFALPPLVEVDVGLTSSLTVMVSVLVTVKEIASFYLIGLILKIPLSLFVQ
ncbi:hypothetical protein [Niallia nealsonii]|uniref:hypothetical protein n=1 Tax=Niallia nealsonii TaxID=115979 RepID=UPI0012FEA011|nr:hypothetical protein [Niallia nealsonii]